MKMYIKNQFKITKNMFIDPVKTTKSKISRQQLVPNICFLIVISFFILLFKFPKNCVVLGYSIFSVNGLYLLVDYILWSIKNMLLLTAVFGTFLWLNCWLNKNKKSIIECFSISTYVLIPTTITGLIFGDILMYLCGSDNTTVYNSLFNILNTSYNSPILIISKIDFFMVWAVVLLSIAGASNSKVSIVQNLEKYVPLWTFAIFTISLIFNMN